MDECLRVFARALADKEGENQFRIGIKRNEYPLVAQIGCIFLPDTGSQLSRPAPAPGASPGDEGRPLDAGMREATPASLHVLGQVGQPYGWKWWPGTELNRRRQPFQSVNFK